MKSRIVLPAGLAVGVLAFTGLAISAVPVDTSQLRDAVTLENIRYHQWVLQGIADANGGNRASGAFGYDASADYVADTLAAAGYQVTRQPFDFPFFEELSTPVLEQVSPNAVVYPPNVADGFITMEYSGSGDVTADLQATNDIVLPPADAANTSTSGCEADDFAGFVPGNIALVQRGSCSFLLKAQNAEAAGATGVIIFNEGQPGRTAAINGTLQRPDVTIPVVGAAFAIGDELYGLLQAGPVVARLAVDAVSELRSTENVIAETAGGRDDRVVVVGAHLDSVPEGPGINDNGSGSAAILEVALQMAELGIAPRNKVRFAWWGAEESGLLGSTFYVAGLSKRDIKDIALNLNFDMIGSPNFVRFVYDGDGSDTPLAGPNGSANIEQVYLDYFADQGLPVEPTAFSGRSDYGPFIAVGIPAGGLFTGAEVAKTEEQADIYGGIPGISYDPCYHLACDTYDNNSDEALDQMSDAVAHSVLTFAMTTSAVNGTDKGSEKALKAAAGMEMLGSHYRQ